MFLSKPDKKHPEREEAKRKVGRVPIHLVHAIHTYLTYLHTYLHTDKLSLFLPFTYTYVKKKKKRYDTQDKKKEWLVYNSLFFFPFLESQMEQQKK